MHCVYIFRSDAFPDQTHVGSTSDLKKRHTKRKSDISIHTNKFKPWDVLADVALFKKHLTQKFERYLKRGPDGKPWDDRTIASKGEWS
jgi:hypothetical protein